MPSTFSPDLRIELMANGGNSGTWGTITNTNLGTIIEDAIAGLANVSITSAAQALTIQDGAADQARCSAFDLTTTTTAAFAAYVPPVTKLYVVKNTSGQTATIKTAAGTGVAVSNGDTTFVFCDGTNVNSVVTSIVNGHVTGNLTVDGTTSLQATTATQVDITGQGDLRLQDTSGGEYVAIQAPATLSASYTLTLPIDDGTSGQALITDGSGNLSWSSAASGDVYGPASATDNAIARFDGTTGKLIQNSAVTIADDGATVISVNTASDALRITQVGAGNALLVEDSSNPDATPFVIDQLGRVVIGDTQVRTGVYSTTPSLSVAGTTLGSSTTALYDYANSSFTGPALLTQKSKSGTIGTQGIVASGDRLFLSTFSGSDGTAFIPAAAIEASVDGTPGTNDMPGRLVFSTTADGASTPTERMRIDNAGRVAIGGTPTAGYTLRLNKAVTGATFAGSELIDAAFQSDVTGGGYGIASRATTAAAAFTLGSLYHFYANPQTIGAPTYCIEYSAVSVNTRIS